MPVSGTSFYTYTAAGAVPDMVQPDQLPHIFTFSDGYKIAFTLRPATNWFYTIRTSGGAWGSNTAIGYSATLNVFRQVSDTIYGFSISGTTLTMRTYPWNASTHVMGTVTSTTYNLTGTIAGETTGYSALDAFWSSTFNAWYLLLFGTATASLYIVSFSSALAALNSNQPTTSFTFSGFALGGASPTASVIYAVMNFGGGDIATYPITVGTGGSIALGAAERAGVSTTTSAIALAFDSSNNLDIVWFDSSAKALHTVKRTGTNVYSAVTNLYSGTVSTVVRPAPCYNSSTGDLWVFFLTTANRATGEIYVAKRTSGAWGTATVAVGGDALGYLYPSASTAFQSSAAEICYVNGVTGGPFTAYYYGVAAGATPNTPSSVTPSGNTVASGSPPTPLISWVYANIIGTDTQLAYEVKVIKVAGGATQWDSGKVTSGGGSVTYGVGSNTGDVNYVAPINLAYNTQYQVQVRVWDTINNSVSAFSAAQTFTLFHAPSGSIFSLASPTGATLSHGSASSTLASNTLAAATSLTVQTGQGSRFTNGQPIAVGVSPTIDLVTISNIATDTLTVSAMAHAHSSTNPVVQAGGSQSYTVTATSIDIVVEVQQADGDSVNQYQVTILDATGTTVVQQGSVTNIGSSIPPGSTFTISNFGLVFLTGGVTYTLQVTLTDATAGLVGNTPLWSIPISYTPPGAATSLVATPHASGGYVHLAWTNGSNTATTTVYRRPTGTSGISQATVLSSGTLRTTLDDYSCPLNTSVDFGVQTVASTGATAAITWVTGITLGLMFSSLGIWLNDVTHPDQISAALGYIDQEDWQSATSWDHIEDVTSYVPMGISKPKKSFGAADYWRYTGRKNWVPSSDTDGSTTQTLAQVKTAIETLNRNHGVVQYRDVNGTVRYISLEAIHEETADSQHGIVSFNPEEVFYQGSPPVV